MNNATTATGIRKVVMSRAHEIARTLKGDYRARMSYALKQAWAEAKQVVAEATQEVAVSQPAPATPKANYVFLFGTKASELPNRGDMRLRKKKGHTINAKHNVWRKRMEPTMVASICHAFETREKKELIVIRKDGVELLMAEVWPMVKRRHPDAKLTLVELEGNGKISFGSFNDKNEWTPRNAIDKLDKMADRIVKRPFHVEDMARIVAEDAAHVILFGSSSPKEEDKAMTEAKQAILSGTPAQLIDVLTLTRTVLSGARVIEKKALYGPISFGKNQTSWECLKQELPSEARERKLAEADMGGFVLEGVKPEGTVPVVSLAPEGSIPVVSLAGGNDDF